jgi:hypothetical protein
MLAALDLVFPGGLILTAAIVLLGFSAAALIVLAGSGFMRTLLRTLMRMLAAFDLSFVTRLIVTASIVFGCHERYSSGFAAVGVAVESTSTT